jgi:hypothetical protein
MTKGIGLPHGEGEMGITPIVGNYAWDGVSTTDTAPAAHIEAEQALDVATGVFANRLDTQLGSWVIHPAQGDVLPQPSVTINAPTAGEIAERSASDTTS